MLKKIARSIVCLGLTCSFALPAFANQQYYAGGGYAGFEFSDNLGDQSADVDALFGRFGAKFNDNFSGEIRAGFGIGSDTLDYFGDAIKVELDSFYGAYLRGGFQLSDYFYPYLLVGYTRGEATASVAGFGSASDSESDVSFGFGTDILISQNISINLDYMNYIDKDGTTITGSSIGIAVAF